MISGQTAQSKMGCDNPAPYYQSLFAVCPCFVRLVKMNPSEMI